jgi:CO/xanthine dehydrogenase Mo-binding subunit
MAEQRRGPSGAGGPAEERKERPPSATGGAETFWGQRADQLDSWLRVEPDGTITAYSGKVELGTGVRTALAQIVAEELDVPFERVRVVMGDTALTPDETRAIPPAA